MSIDQEREVIIIPDSDEDRPKKKRKAAPAGSEAAVKGGNTTAGSSSCRGNPLPSNSKGKAVDRGSNAPGFWTTNIGPKGDPKARQAALSTMTDLERSLPPLDQPFLNTGEVGHPAAVIMQSAISLMASQRDNAARSSKRFQDMIEIHQKVEESLEHVKDQYIVWREDHGWDH
ncbi:hypothetical protein EWM64_g6571 [Hericium alpestre]|uniref:Uncharacterized protein n=1 Tax=Hericium alpestre TaxID=135208 RepID=A0A4Y9ZUC4_9AGAM|nr:hypothetical protein EWM64_g6571 [Hericium alpestre]